jgi:hypothetical protein
MGLMTQAQGEYLSLMGPRLGSHVSILEEIDREEDARRQVIRTQAPLPRPMGTFEQTQRSWESKAKRRGVFWDCPDLDAIEDLERRSSAATGLGYWQSPTLSGKN